MQCACQRRNKAMSLKNRDFCRWGGSGGCPIRAYTVRIQTAVAISCGLALGRSAFLLIDQINNLRPVERDEPILLAGMTLHSEAIRNDTK